jgi:hypothetical protein
MKEELAVEWFANRISHGGLVTKKQFDELLEQAKEMEKEHIVNAHYQGYRSSIGTTEISENYYKETFKQEQ